MSKKDLVTIGVSVLLSLLLVLGLGGFGSQSISLAGFNRTSSVNVIPVDSTDGFSVGTTTNATLITYIGSGTCTLTSNSSIAATSTGTGTCATPGSQVGDIVTVGPLATTTTNLNAQWNLIGAVAGSESTTVRLLNLTGTAAVPAATSGLGSTTPYQIFRVTSAPSSMFDR